MTFSKNVFVNCPFDAAYYPLLRPLLFTIYYLDFVPRIATEELDSGKPRFDKLTRLIAESRYAIHDLSRLKASREGEFYRLNMPFEFGLDVGCRIYKGGKWSAKRCLILEAKRFRYQAALSDVSNSDIAVHENKPVRLISEVRNWLNHEASLNAAGPRRIWADFNDFMDENDRTLRANGFHKRDVENLPVCELMRYMKNWIQKNTK